MRLYQRASLILAYEGVSGLLKRVIRKLFPAHHIHELSSTEKLKHELHKREYDKLVTDFNEKAMQMGYGDLKGSAMQKPYTGWL